jgi:hypothetical protein
VGLRPFELIEQAARHLLAVLQTQGSILYSSFYDASQEPNARLCEGIGISVEDGEWYSAEALIDTAAAQLEQQGIVELDWLDARLVDDEPDYRITLTDAGRSALQAGTQLWFYDSK